MSKEYILYTISGFILFLLVLKISKKIFKLFLFLAIGLLIVVAVTGCSGGGSKLNVATSLEDISENTLTRINDMPFIKKSKIDIERSLIMGEGKSWSGQLKIYVPLSKTEVFNFYVKNLVNLGWKEQTTIRGETSILNYVGENNRVAIITIREARFNNADLLISVSPYTEEFEDIIGEYINEKYLDITEKNGD